MQPSSRARIERWALGVLLLFLSSVLAWRAVGLVREPLEPSGQREKRFLGWAWREPDPGEVLARVEALLVPGEPVMLALSAKEAQHADWWQFMAIYYLPRNPVVGVKGRVEILASPMPEATVVWITPRGEAAAPGAPISSERQIAVIHRGSRPVAP